MTKQTDKQLVEKAIDIKGKKYVLVSDRIIYFNETYPNGSIVTDKWQDGDMVICQATVTPDCDHRCRYFTGRSQAKRGDGFINKTSALENAETSAVGRALAMMGIGVIDSIASVDEINKAENTAKAQSKSFKKESRFQMAMNNIDFIKQCLDENDFINKIKGKYEMDEIQEGQLRRRYQELTSEETSDLPFN